MNRYAFTSVMFYMASCLGRFLRECDNGGTSWKLPLQTKGKHVTENFAVLSGFSKKNVLPLFANMRKLAIYNTDCLGWHWYRTRAHKVSCCWHCSTKEKVNAKNPLNRMKSYFYSQIDYSHFQNEPTIFRAMV